MEEKEKIYIASLAFEKCLEYEELKYSDYMYGKEDETDDVWEFVIECQDIGKMAFNEKYGNYDLYF